MPSGFKILLTFLLSMFALILGAQDTYFSQYFANRLYLNPAWAGVDDCRRLSLNYRNQWPSTDNTYVTYSAAYDQFVEPLKGGIGITLFNDSQGKGIISEFGMSAIYSYHLDVSRDISVNAGFQAAYVQKRLNTSNFIFGDMLNPDGSILPYGDETYGTYRIAYPDFAFGMTGFYRGVYTGFAMYHLTKPFHSVSEDPFSRLPRKITFFAGGIIPINEKRLGKEVLQISPNIIFIQQGNFNQVNYGAEAFFKNYYLAGIWLRQNFGIRYSSMIVSGGITADKIRLRYSYDFRLSHPSVSMPLQGAHEVSLIILMGFEKKINRRTIKCLKI